MAALAPMATGFGQGMLQRQALGREQDRFGQQQQLAERGIALQERGMQLDDDWRKETFARGEMDKLKAKKADPHYGRKYTIRQQAEDDDRIAELEARFPNVFASPSYRTPDASREAEAPGSRVGEETPTAATPTPFGDLRNPSLFGGVRPYETGMVDPLAGGPTGNHAPPPPAAGPPAPADAQPITDQQVSSLMRETDPNFNIAQNALRQPPAAAAPVAAPQAPPAPDGRPQPGMSNRSVIELAQEQSIIRAFRQAKDPSLPPAVQDELTDRAMGLVMNYAKYNQGAAEELFTRIQAGEFPETQEQTRAESRERVTASQMQRNVFTPRELNIQEETNRIKRLAVLADEMEQRRLSDKERQQLEMELRKYGLSVAQFRTELAVKKQEARERNVRIEKGKKDLAEPDFLTKFAMEMAGKYAYHAGPYSKQFQPGPTLGNLQQFVPGLGGGAAEASQGRGRPFYRKEFLEGTKGFLTPEQQKQEIENMRKAGYTIK